MGISPQGEVMKITAISSAIKAFNAIQKSKGKPCNFKFSGITNIQAFDNLIDKVGEIEEELWESMIKEFTGSEFTLFCDWVCLKLSQEQPAPIPQEPEKPAEESKESEIPKAEEKVSEEPPKKDDIPTPAVKPIPVVPVEESSPMLHLNALESAIANSVVACKGDWIRQQIVGNLDEEVRKFIFDTYGPISRKIVLDVDGTKVDMGEEILHEKFEDILKFTSLNIPCFLTGPAGSGKSVICQQVAKALGLKFYFSNAITQEYKITGFTDANGVYQETPFYKAFKDGGLFFLDEIDASIPEVLVILNAAIANRVMDFPAPIGNVEAHDDFRVIAAGNTVGQGADMEYVGRFQLDAATLDRFAVVKVDYSQEIEVVMANGDGELLEFCRSFRDTVSKVGIKAIVSYRGIKNLKKALSLINPVTALSSCLLKSLSKDDLNMIKSSYTGNQMNKYFGFFNKAIKEAK